MYRLAPVLIVLSWLAACGDRRDPPLRPPPLAQAGAPDTSVMGAGPGTAGPQPGRCGPVVPQEVLQQINAVRAAGYRCGGTTMGPAAALQWDGALLSAAAGHSLDMARRNYLDHRSPDGHDVAQRVSAAHYRWRSVGENVAGGEASLADALRGWLESPEHCRNLLDPRFRDVALACEAQPGSQWGTYWTLVLGRQ